MSSITYVYPDDDQFKEVETFRFTEHFKSLVVSTVSYITISYVRHRVHTASLARSVSIPVGKTVIFPRSRAYCSAAPYFYCNSSWNVECAGWVMLLEVNVKLPLRLPTGSWNSLGLCVPAVINSSDGN